MARKKCAECREPFAQGDGQYGRWCRHCREHASKIDEREQKNVEAALANADTFAEQVKREAGLL